MYTHIYINIFFSSLNDHAHDDDDDDYCDEEVRLMMSKMYIINNILVTIA